MVCRPHKGRRNPARKGINNLVNRPASFRGNLENKLYYNQLYNMEFYPVGHSPD